jgi:eukaryotic-like serine/threonine-protein kinase
MADLDAHSLADTAAMIGLVTRGQAREAVADATDGSIEAISRSFLRKGFLTSWQLDRLKKEDPTGFFFGGHKVLFHLAEGTFARVYRGVKPETNEAVAIKVLRNRFVTDAAAVERFHNEAEAGMKMRHENIVRILDHGNEEKKAYMIMEYVEGANLRDFLKIRGKLPPEEALPLMLGMARGLKYSNDKGVTHRDIKATNILISNSGEAKLVDFGLAGIEGDDAKSSMKSQRTIDYSALERTCGSEKGDARSDIYFMGSVFYQLLTGSVPMKETESKDMLQKMLVRSFNSIVPLHEHRMGFDADISAIVDKMMKVELRSRYQKMDDVIVDLEHYETKLKTGIIGLDTVGEDDEFMADIEELFTHRTDTAGGGSTETSKSAGKKKHVLCVEAQTEIQDAFRKSLSKLGYRVFLVSDAENAAERYREDPPDAVIFDADGLGEEALAWLIDMHDTALEEGRVFAALVLLGPRQKALKDKLPTDGNLIVLPKPVKMKQVQFALTNLIPKD